MRSRPALLTAVSAVPVCLALALVAAPSQAAKKSPSADPDAAVRLFTTHIPPLDTIDGVPTRAAPTGRRSPRSPGPRIASTA